MAIAQLLNEFSKLYYGSIPNKEYIIDKSAVKVDLWQGKLAVKIDLCMDK